MVTGVIVPVVLVPVTRLEPNVACVALKIRAVECPNQKYKRDGIPRISEQKSQCPVFPRYWTALIEVPVCHLDRHCQFPRWRMIRPPQVLADFLQGRPPPFRETFPSNHPSSRPLPLVHRHLEVLFPPCFW